MKISVIMKAGKGMRERGDWEIKDTVGVWTQKRWEYLGFGDKI